MESYFLHVIDALLEYRAFNFERDEKPLAKKV